MKLPLDNRCGRVRRLLSDRTDAALCRRDELLVRRHLLVCPGCRREAAFYRQLRLDARALGTRAVPAFLWERISLKLDEHPWGGENKSENRKSLFHPFGYSPAAIKGPALLAGLILTALFCLLPGGDGIGNQPAGYQVVRAEDEGARLPYLSLYMISQNSNFPLPVREYYLRQIEALDHKIELIREALDRFPENRRIQAQLAQAYAHKLALYRQIGAGGQETPDDLSEGNTNRNGKRYQ